MAFALELEDHEVWVVAEGLRTLSKYVDQIFGKAVAAGDAALVVDSAKIIGACNELLARLPATDVFPPKALLLDSP